MLEPDVANVGETAFTSSVRYTPFSGHWPSMLSARWPPHSSQVVSTISTLSCTEPQCKSFDSSTWWRMLLLVWWLDVASMSTSLQCSVMSYTSCWCLSEYSSRSHFSCSPVSEAPVLHTSSTSAYWQWIFRAMPISALCKRYLTVLRTAIMELHK